MTESDKKVVTRFAPSPTGFMHVGGVRTALYAYLWAKKHQGEFILRIEDTDQEREVKGSIEHILDSLKWLGIEWDKGPIKQSERLDIYKKYAQKLIDKGLAYPDPYTKEELDAMRQNARDERRAFLFRDHRPESFDTWDGSKPLRFKVPEIKEYRWNDAVRGELSAGAEMLDDFVLIKSDGYPTYNFAHVVDDYEMGITHVMRADEFISSTPKFLSLHEALEIEPPAFVTLPPIMAEGGKKKLSKRDGAKDILDYKEEGYLPEAINNFLALLGWHPSDEKEIFSEKELLEAFDISKVGISGAQLDKEKLDWINKEHLKLIPQEELFINIKKYLPEKIKNEKILPLVAERIHKYGDIEEMFRAGEFDFVFKSPSYDENKLIYKDVALEKIKENISLAIKALENLTEETFDVENIKHNLMLLAEQLDSRGELLHPVRFALSGRDKSPDPFTIAYIIGKDETLERLQKVV